MRKLPKSLLYRGVVYHRVAAPPPPEDEDIETQTIEVQAEDELQAAVEAIGGELTGERIGDLADDSKGQRRTQVEVVATISNVAPISDLGKALPYDTIVWKGWVKAQLDGESITITAEGPLAFDGAFQDDLAKIMSEDDVLYGEWDGMKWTWQKSVRGAYS
jgi:hypothetical protein